MSANAQRRRERRAAIGRRSDERWQGILAGAAEVFRREGFVKARLEDVAAEVGVNRATLYYYVGTKEELLYALLEGPAHEMTQHCRAALALDLPPDEKLAAALRAYVEDLIAHPELFLVFSENVEQVMSGADAEEIAVNADAYGKTILAIIEEGVATEVFRRDLDPRLAMLGILGMFNWIHRWYVPGGRNTLEQIGETFVAMTLGALRP